MAMPNAMDRVNKTRVGSYHGVGNMVVIVNPDKSSFDGAVVIKPSRSGFKAKWEAEALM